MLSKAQIKHITALRTKKYRTEHAQFVVEGKKSTVELLKSDYDTLHVYYQKEHEAIWKDSNFKNKTLVSAIEINKISAQKNPEGVVAIAQMPRSTSFNWAQEQYIALDQVRDPGNLGTIIRLADWFGIKTLLCSKDCVEQFNPKVIQASMGSLFNTEVQYIDFIEEFPKANIPILASTLTGPSIYNEPFFDKGVLVIGNEANGISKQVLELCTAEISIPAKGKAESLNAAMACGILCSHLFR